MNVFEAVKQSVTTRQAAEHYGIRVGRNGMCVCHFHEDKNLSMKVDWRFHCFGCQADGDVIDLVSRLENVSPREAALMLAQDFSIPYEDRELPGRSRRPQPRQESPEQQFWRMEPHCFRVLSNYHNLLRHWKRDYAPKTPDEEWQTLPPELRQAVTDTIEAAPPSRSVEEVKAMMEGTEKGGVRNSIHNCLTVFQYDPVLSGAVGKNLLTERIDLLKPIGRKRRTGSKAMTDMDMKYIRLYLEDTYGLTSEKKIADAADLAADANSYHPIRDYLNGLTWDGKERIRYCLCYFLGADTDTFQSLWLFLLGAGKSTFFRLLAVKDEWFSDDLRKLDDDNVYRKLQGHWIIEMSEMIATVNAKSIEEIKSFPSRQKEVYKIPYETHPEDRLRQCVFGGNSNAMDFLPLDRSGNRRFLPVMVYPEQAEVHILDDEAASRAYIEQVWAEAMITYKSGDFKLSFTPEIIQYLKEHQRDFMPEDTKAGMIQAFLDLCSKQLFKEALNRPFDEPKQWEIREVNDIMNHCITGWKYFSNPRIFEGYGRQRLF